MQIGPGASDESEDGDDEPAAPPLPVRKRFWSIVVLLNLGLFAVSLGVMLAGFRGQYEYGAMFVGGGLVVLYSAYRRYQSRHEVFETVD